MSLPADYAAHTLASRTQRGFSARGKTRAHLRHRRVAVVESPAASEPNSRLVPAAVAATMIAMTAYFHAPLFAALAMLFASMT